MSGKNALNTGKGEAMLRYWHGEEPRDVALVVDDEKHCRDWARFAIKTVLSRYRVKMAGTPAEAVAMLSDGFASTAALIITDGNMPGLKGWQLARVIRGARIGGVNLPETKVDLLKRVPVILSSGSMALRDEGTIEGRELHTAMRDGAINGFLPKPCRPVDLCRETEVSVKRVMGMDIPLGRNEAILGGVNI